MTHNDETKYKYFHNIKKHNFYFSIIILIYAQSKLNEKKETILRKMLNFSVLIVRLHKSFQTMKVSLVK